MAAKKLAAKKQMIALFDWQRYTYDVQRLAPLDWMDEEADWQGYIWMRSPWQP